MIFDITIDRRSDELAVLGMSGDFDLRVAPAVKAELIDLVDDGAREIIVDMTEATFLDSTALGALAGAAKRLHAVDGELTIVCTDRSIVRIFEITGLDRVLPLHRTLDDALALLPLATA